MHDIRHQESQTNSSNQGSLCPPLAERHRRTMLARFESQPDQSIVPPGGLLGTIFFLFFVAEVFHVEPSVKVSLSRYSFARCLDGSAAAFYLSRGTNRSAFVIFLDAPGWCTTLDECYRRANSSTGSARGFARSLLLREMDTRPQLGQGVLDRNVTANIAATWQHVYVPSCDGGGFLGNTTVAARGDRPALYLRGRAILAAVVEELRSADRFSSATHVMLSGCSTELVDWMATQISSKVAVLSTNQEQRRCPPQSAPCCDECCAGRKPPHAQAVTAQVLE